MDNLLNFKWEYWNAGMMNKSLRFT